MIESEILDRYGDRILDVWVDDDDDEIPYGKASCHIQGGKTYEIDFVAVDHFVGANLCEAFDCYGYAGGPTLCGVAVWLQNAKDNRRNGKDYSDDKIQSVHFCGNLDGNTFRAL